MWETIILTTFLLLMFLGLRYIVDGKISAKFQYALWLIVAVRLLFAWVPLPDSGISILPLVRDSVGTITQVAQNFLHPDGGKDSSMADREAVMDVDGDDRATTDREMVTSPELSGNGGITQDSGMAVAPGLSGNGEITAGNGIAVGDGLADSLSDSEGKSTEQKGVSDISGKRDITKAEDTTGVEEKNGITKILLVVYGIGVCIMFVVIVLRNILFYLRLRKKRIAYEGELPFKQIPGRVYLLEHTASPFLFGRNIYIAPEMPKAPESFRYCLAHETCHYRQGDLFWSVIRNLCLVMYWYHPLVWLCVRLSGNDGELACDERAISMLGEEHRLDYGAVLLALIKEQMWGSNHFNLSTQMSGSKRNVQKRMKRIARKKKQGFIAVIFVIIGMGTILLSTLPDSLASGKDEWTIVTEAEGFPAMVVDENGDVVDFVRGNLLKKMYLSYYGSEVEMGPYRIKENAFSDCTNLKTLIISNHGYIEEIADNAFVNCPKNMVVYCEKDTYVWDYFKEKGFRVKEYNEIDDEAWQMLGSKLTDRAKILFITSQGYDPENYIYTKKDVRTAYGEPYFVMTTSGELLRQYQSESLTKYSEIEVLFPKEAKALAATFCGAGILTKSVTIPNHIIEIGDSAFQDCPIEQVEFEEGSKLEKIGACAFIQTRLSEIKLPEGLKEIGRNAFCMCNNLKEVTIPSSVEKLDRGCFYADLESVTILNPDTEFPDDVKTEPVFNPYMYDEKTQDIVPNTKFTIHCYKGSTAEAYAKKLNLKVEYLTGSPDDNKVSGGETAVKDEWSGVTQKEGFPAMVVDEDGNIVDFARGNLLHKMYLDYYGNAVGYRPYNIKKKAFSGCSNLKTLIIKDSSYITDIAGDAFEGCPEDMVVYCGEGSTVWNYFKERGFHVETYEDKEDIIADRRIGSWMSLGENPEELEKIVAKLTEQTSDNITLTKEELRKVYGEPYFVMTKSGALPKQAELYSLQVYSETEIRLPKEAKVLGGIYANCILGTEKVTIPKGVIEIGEYAFMAGEIKNLEFENGSKLKKIGFRSFLGNQFTTVKLPEGLEEIGREAFFECHSLKEVTIPGSVKRIEENSFALCDNLETVTVFSKDAEFVEGRGYGMIFDDSFYSEEEEDFVPNTKLTIRCYQGSTAETYAKKLNLKVEYIK